MPVKRQKRREKLVFTSTVFPSRSSETQALLLAESIRAFAGSLAQAPIWFLTPSIGKKLSATFKKRLHVLNVLVIPFKIDSKTLNFPLAGDVLAAALAEAKARTGSSLLAWLASNTVVIKEPKKFLLPSDKTLGFGPVHHTLIGSSYKEPLDPFWTSIYRYCNVPETRVFPMVTHVDGTKIRPYFNAGLLVTRPETRLLQVWRDTFFRVYRESVFQKFYEKDERYAVFIHQAVLSGVILSMLGTSELQELPPTYNYPVHLYAQDVSGHRPSSLEELVTFRHEGFYTDPQWINKMPAKKPLKQWIASVLRALKSS
jgi:hypothetical protein